MSDIGNLSENVLQDPPKDLEAERSFLGALMQDGTLMAVISDALGTLSEEEFASERNRIIYAAILKRSTTSDDFNPTLICDQLETDGNLERAGGRGYVASLVIRCCD